MQKNEQWVVWGLSIPIGGGLKIGCALLGVWYYPMGLFSASVYGGWCGYRHWGGLVTIFYGYIVANIMPNKIKISGQPYC